VYPVSSTLSKLIKGQHLTTSKRPQTFEQYIKINKMMPVKMLAVPVGSKYLTRKKKNPYC